jgi:hypothetical protein
MKYKILIVFLVLFSKISNSQVISDFEISAGMPILLAKINNSHRQHTIRGVNSNFLAGIPLQSENSRWKIHTGLSFFRLKEVEKSSEFALGGGYENIYRHTAVGFTTKFRFELNISDEFSYGYIGAILGKYLYTKTKGEEDFWMIQSPEFNSGTNYIDTNGKEFFHSVYGGLEAGFVGKSKNKRIIPAFEIAFLPEFITVDDKRRSALLLSAILKINKKSYPKPDSF